jgi:hypothetical protein
MNLFAPLQLDDLELYKLYFKVITFFLRRKVLFGFSRTCLFVY